MKTAIGTKFLPTDDYLWVGPSGGSWDAVKNWADTTAGQNPALYVPGALASVTIAGPTGSASDAITGGGSAGSIGLTGNVRLDGGYTANGALKAGSPTLKLTVGSLALTEGSTITAASINMLAGTLSLAANSTLSTSGALSVGSGTLDDKAGRVSVGGALTKEGGRIAVTSGGTLTIGGVVTNAGGVIAVNGAGSKLIMNGALTATDGGSYGFSSNGQARGSNGSIVAVSDGFAQLSVVQGSGAWTH